MYKASTRCQTLAGVFSSTSRLEPIALLDNPAQILETCLLTFMLTTNLTKALGGIVPTVSSMMWPRDRNCVKQPTHQNEQRWVWMETSMTADEQQKLWKQPCPPPAWRDKHGTRDDAIFNFTVRPLFGSCSAGGSDSTNFSAASHVSSAAPNSCNEFHSLASCAPRGWRAGRRRTMSPNRASRCARTQVERSSVMHPL